MIRRPLRDRAHPTTPSFGVIEEQNLRVRAALSNLLRMLQRGLHDVLSASHDRMLRSRDELPPLTGNANPEAQGRENVEENVRIRFHFGILHAARSRPL